MSATFEEFVGSERAALLKRARLRAIEAEADLASDDMGRYWLARTRCLEAVAAAARDIDETASPMAHAELRAALQELEQVHAPVCRPGDHA